MIELATWNICLGIKNKKDYVYDTLAELNVDICAIQEVEIPKDYPSELLANKNYILEVELSTTKARCAMAIKNGINYVRRNDLEMVDTSVVIIDVNSDLNYRIINVYRSFNPPNGITQKVAFAQQLNLIKTAVSNSKDREIIILGDFNLDEIKHNATDYARKDLFDDLDGTFDPLNLIQMVKFPTWQRIVNNELKQSTLDHIYVQNPLIINQIRNFVPLIGDHVLVITKITGTVERPKVTIKRDWRSYSKQLLLTKLQSVQFKVDGINPQELWNNFETVLMPVIDEIIPYAEFANNIILQSNSTPSLYQKQNERQKETFTQIKD